MRKCIKYVHFERYCQGWRQWRNRRGKSGHGPPSRWAIDLFPHPMKKYMSDTEKHINLDHPSSRISEPATGRRENIKYKWECRYNRRAEAGKGEIIYG